ncbi:ABC transporter ATP-binding protein [Aestuariimicrobium sp. T2.26MG-19.2B]|uniref:ABC transporter ATP-binding protein n=1 Tax=Aestuariimicrobium sp. T2.26MG-19.2B TaxID=3040679 RepID=UPI002477A2E1|nr:ABC transporter ATP-binding protein [Aestuariimicrobium sp. T2.26MG-19.2B]CAI9401822.1 Vitamin B12 import ATP-binding protein BtuD [Aestuariimicrobium sp. T2.26MG-19.2B]
MSEASTTAALEVRGVRASYGPTEVLHGVDLSVPTGAVLAVVGPSGSGKTTLLRCIGGFEPPTAGEVRIQGTPVCGPLWVPPHKRSIGYVSQDGALFPHLSVGANVGFGLPRHERTTDRIADLLAKVNLSADLASRRPDQLSGGQQQRVSLARALARRPAVMLLDEPFSSLDTHLREATRDLVGEVLRGAGVTTLLVTHDQEEALAFADLVAVLDGGELRQVGAPQVVYERPVDLATARLLGSTLELDAIVSGGIAQTVIGPVPALGVDEGRATVIARPHQVSARLDIRGRWVVRQLAFHGDHRRLTLGSADGSVDHEQAGGGATFTVSTDQPVRVGDRMSISLIGRALVVPDSGHHAASVE